MLRANPNLPRLTRGEILDLIENLTKTELGHRTPFQPSHFVKANNVKLRDPKAIMMVLPYTPDAANENNVEDLFTKPPITQIIDQNQLKQQEKDKDVLTSYEVPNIQFDHVKEPKKTLRPTKKYKGNQYPETSTSTTTTTTSPTTPKHYSEERKPQRHFRRKSTTVTTSTTTPNPPSKRFRSPTRKYSTTTRRYHNHRYEDEVHIESSTSSSSTVFPNHGIKIVKPPVLPPKNINDDLILSSKDVNKAEFTEKHIPVSYVPVKDIDLAVSDNKEEYEDAPFVVEIPEHLKGVLSELNLESALKTVQGKQNKTIAKSSSKPKTSNKEDVELNNLLETLKLLAAQTSTTTTTPLPDVSDVVNNLSPDMKDLLMNFGLIPNSNSPKPVSDTPIYESFNSEKAEVKPEFYTGFKPLPEDNNSRDEMQELLMRFGLGRSSRKQKSFRNKENFTLDMVPSEYHDVLQDIGIGTKNDDLESASSQMSLKKLPVDNNYATDEELKKLNKLTNIVSQLENLNRTLTDEDLKNIDTESLRHLVESLNKSYLNDFNKPLDEQYAPDPVDAENIIKNEVKREEKLSESDKSSEVTTKQPDATNEPPISASTEKTTTIKIEMTSQATETPSIKDLEDSFGGPQNGEADSSEMTEAPSPPAPETGFYYLLDWNTFLDIDDQKGKHVNLRFQPKVGNPLRFVSVSVP